MPFVYNLYTNDYFIYFSRFGDFRLTGEKSRKQIIKVKAISDSKIQVARFLLEKPCDALDFCAKKMKNIPFVYNLYTNGAIWRPTALISFVYKLYTNGIFSKNRMRSQLWSV